MSVAPLLYAHGGVLAAPLSVAIWDACERRLRRLRSREVDHETVSIGSTLLPVRSGLPSCARQVLTSGSSLLSAPALGRTDARAAPGARYLIDMREISITSAQAPVAAVSELARQVIETGLTVELDE